MKRADIKIGDTVQVVPDRYLGRQYAEAFQDVTVGTITGWAMKDTSRRYANARKTSDPTDLAAGEKLYGVFVQVERSSTKGSEFVPGGKEGVYVFANVLRHWGPQDDQDLRDMFQRWGCQDSNLDYARPKLGVLPIALQPNSGGGNIQLAGAQCWKLRGTVQAAWDPGSASGRS